MKKLYGVTTAMITPMYENGEINLEGTKELTNFLIDKGVDCLYPLGTTGEMFKLSVSERKRVAEAVIQTANNRVNVFIHVGAMNQRDTIDLAQHAYEAGADGIGVVTPAFFSANDYEIEEYYATVSKKLPSDFPIYLYSIPQLSGNELSIPVVKKLVEKYENIIGIKYSYPDFVMLKDYLAVGNDGFSALTGADSLFLPALALGCDGVVSGVSCVFPEPFVEIYKAYQNKELDRARELQRHADKLITLLKGGSNMSYFKKAIEYRGIQAGSVKAPQLDIGSQEEKELIEKLDGWKLNIPLVIR
ncbi:dihydrodipicolinate synthase family protein [Oceanobacillus sp. FSL K6-2867]|uniref:dihydrodipicolinate synthase family protein n=1 Tax=Oceanobacillus sp. FSL K6-2867 TaxID=2954748 RepID=UPI0030DACC8F